MGVKTKLYSIVMLGTNCYLVWDENSKEAMLIDPGAYEFVIEQDINDNGLELKYIFLTHGHYDHIEGVDGFILAFPSAILAAHVGDRSIMNGLEPEMILNEGEILNLGELSFNVITTPGHTEGGLCLYIAESDVSLTDQSFSGMLFSGDTLFRMSVGRTDLGGGDFDTLRSSIQEKLLILPDDTLVLPGHMGATTIGNEKQYNTLIK